MLPSPWQTLHLIPRQDLPPGVVILQHEGGHVCHRKAEKNVVLPRTFLPQTLGVWLLGLQQHFKLLSLGKQSFLRTISLLCTPVGKCKVSRRGEVSPGYLFSPTAPASFLSSLGILQQVFSSSALYLCCNILSVSLCCSSVLPSLRCSLCFEC